MLREKGKSIILFPNNYVIVDIETTGLSAEWDSILEIGAIKVENDIITDRFHSFIAYNDEIPQFITYLTGITNEMLIGAPLPQNAINDFCQFLGNNLIVGYNVNFDINFLYDYRMNYHSQKLTNDYIDCMRIARKLFPELQHHRLKDMVEFLNIPTEKAHRALDDCLTTNSLFTKLHKIAVERFGSEEMFYNEFRHSSHGSFNLKELTPKNKSFDISHPLYGKSCVFTGKLEKLLRKDAAQAVLDIGGKIENNVTRKTDFLILGNNDYCPSIKDGKSSKQKKAESLIEKGQDLSIITENDFYDLICTYGGTMSLKKDSDMFGCCSKYKECSEAKKCIRNDERALACWYRKNLEEGKIFF